MHRRILLAEDGDRTFQDLKKLLESDAQIHVDAIHNGKAALQALTEHQYSIFLTDMVMPGLGGMELIEEIQKRNLPVAVIVMTNHASIDEAVQTMRLGAYDILTKPIDPRHLRMVVQRVLRERRQVDELSALREQLQSKFSFRNIISRSPCMHAVFELISNVAQTPTTVLIEGETGTGKEQVARAIHQASPIRTGPIIAINCAALPETLLESELFGHEKGAFTSAVGKRAGRFELANGGTIFLDEVGDIPPSMQAKLLRVLQERRFERVGGTESIEVDVRVIAATNRSLQKLVHDGKFREDLFYRINVVKIDLPPLRDRREDIPLLAAYFAEKYARPGEAPKKILPQTMEILLNYAWPGNIRELENAIERACVTSQSDSILPQFFPAELLHGSKTIKLTNGIDLNQPLPDLLRRMQANIEEEYIRRALEQCHGSVSRCAQKCGISRRSLSAKLSAYRINKAAFKELLLSPSYNGADA